MLRISYRLLTESSACPKAGGSPLPKDLQTSKLLQEGGTRSRGAGEGWRSLLARHPPAQRHPFAALLLY